MSRIWSFYIRNGSAGMQELSIPMEATQSEVHYYLCCLSRFIRLFNHLRSFLFSTPVRVHNLAPILSQITYLSPSRSTTDPPLAEPEMVDPIYCTVAYRITSPNTSGATMDSHLEIANPNAQALARLWVLTILSVLLPPPHPYGTHTADAPSSSMTCRADGLAFPLPASHISRRASPAAADRPQRLLPLAWRDGGGVFQTLSGHLWHRGVPTVRRPGEADTVYFAQILEEVGDEWVQLPLAGGGVFLRGLG